MGHEQAYKLNLFRGVGWLVIAFIGALLIGSGKLTEWGMNEYAARWLGILFKVGSGAWGGYRISRDVLKIDPSSIQLPTAYALMHLARAIVVGMVILAVTQGV